MYSEIEEGGGVRDTLLQNSAMGRGIFINQIYFNAFWVKSFHIENLII